MKEFYSKQYPLQRGEGHLTDDETFFLETNGKTQMTPGRFLDVGCAEGARDKTAIHLGWDAYGVELSETFCETARGRLHLYTVFNGTLHEANYPAGFFDYVLMWHVLEHVRDATAILAEIVRVLNPGGVLNIGVPNVMEPLYWTERAISHLWRRTPSMSDSAEHTYGFTPVTLRKMVTKVGLKVKRADVYYEPGTLNVDPAANWKGRLQTLMCHCWVAIWPNRYANRIALRAEKTCGAS